MSEKFEREERYIVFKVKDLSEHKLGWVHDVIRLNDIPTVEAVVVEADWPEYEPTWAAIERRVTGAVQWDGDGLPPAGATVEFTLNVGKSSWEQGVVIGPDGNNQVVIRHGNNYHARNRHSVRPIRTPEQIAAEERDNAIAEMVETARKATGFGQNRSDYAALYDAGYRKQVAP